MSRYIVPISGGSDLTQTVRVWIVHLQLEDLSSFPFIETHQKT